MANEKNLIPVRSGNEAREKGARGGKKSGETRRRKRDLKSTMKMILNLPVLDVKVRNMLSADGVPPEETTNQTLMTMALFREAAAGNVQAFKEIRSLIGEDNDAERLKLQKKETKLKEDAAQKNNPTETEQPKLYEALEADDDV